MIPTISKNQRHMDEKGWEKKNKNKKKQKKKTISVRSK